ncbi:SIS domain-containing protein [Leifsonia sp. 2TAF2]|uniref:SIS domain-containing protein n=1 Tax=Leifsonia sp. 2TAF2 TaxID=3233009 RepID=UPI003F98AB33
MAHQKWLTFEEGVAAQARVVDGATPAVLDWFEQGHVDHLRGRSILLAGIGASYAAAATPTHELRAAGVTALRSACSDIPDESAALADAYVGISQGGRSRETIQALLTVPREMRLAVVNAADSPLASASGSVLGLGDLIDSSMSSIGFSATVVALGLLVERLTGKPHDSSWAGIGARAADICAANEGTLARFATEIAERGYVDVVARPAELTAAEQGGLLFREGPALPSMAMDTRSYLHGPMDCAGPATSHVLLGGGREALLAEQLAEKEVPILLIADDDVSAPASIVRIPRMPATQRAYVEVVLLQRLVQLTAAAIGKDIEERAFTRYDTKVDSVQQVVDGTV